MYVFIVPKEESKDGERFRPGPSIGSNIHLPIATSITNDLIRYALQLADKIFEDGRLYKKAGIILSGIVPDDSIQGNLFVNGDKNKERLLMNVMDNINFSMRDDILKFAASGTTRNWKMQQSFHSPLYTTCWDEMYEIK